MKSENAHLGFGTLAIHAGQEPDPTTGAGHDTDLSSEHVRAGVSRKTSRLRIFAHPTIPRVPHIKHALPLSKALSTLSRLLRG